MGSETRPNEVTYERPEPVDIEALERELRRLWEEAEEEGAVEGIRTTRASLLSIVVYCVSEEAAQEASDIVSRLTREHPCRAIVIEADPGAAEPSVRAWVSAHCHLAGANRLVCCEQIRVRAAGEAVHSLPGVLEPLLVSDMPAFLWWRAPHVPSGPLLERAREAFGVLIVDSCQWEEPDRELRGLRELAAGPPDHMHLVDLCWIKLESWREAIARLFDPPEVRQALRELRRVRISSGCRVAALLLVGWLGSRLQWKMVEGTAGPVGPGGAAITVELSADREAPDITSVALEAEGDAAGRFTVTADPTGTGLTAKAVVADQAEREYRLSWQPLELQEALCGALELLEGDPVLEAAVSAAGQLLGRVDAEGRP